LLPPYERHHRVSYREFDRRKDAVQLLSWNWVKPANERWFCFILCTVTSNFVGGASSVRDSNLAPLVRENDLKHAMWYCRWKDAAKHQVDRKKIHPPMTMAPIARHFLSFMIWFCPVSLIPKHWTNGWNQTPMDVPSIPGWLEDATVSVRFRRIWFMVHDHRS
jgi:hypothetical protein